MHNKVIKNATWIIACKFAQALIAFLINMLTARYLGPTNFGTISYASSLVAFVVPIMQLGMNNILVQEIIQKPDFEGEVVGTALAMSILSSIACVAGVVTFACIINGNEKETIIVCALYSLLLLFQAVDIIQYWFQAKLLSKYTSVAILIAYILVAVYKSYLLISKKNIYWFAVSNALDYFFVAVILIVVYHKLGGQKLSFSVAIAKEMLQQGKYYIVSGLMITIFTQTDRIMLKLMIGDTVTGYYSAATSCAVLTNFVFSAIIDSARPTIIEAQKKGDSLYRTRMIQLYSIVFYLSVIQCVVMTCFAKEIVLLIYGSAYLDSIFLLKIVVWYTLFSYLGAVRSVWILTQKKHKYIIGMNLSGASANVILNYILIPSLGASGAAIASVVTQFFTNVVMGYIVRPISENNDLMIEGLKPKYVINMCKGLISGKNN